MIYCTQLFCCTLICSSRAYTSFESHRAKSLPVLSTLGSHQIRRPSSRAREVMVGGLLSRFRPGETQSRRGTHSSDSVHSANPEECGAGVTHPDTAHEMRIPLRPLRMSKPYRRLRKRSLRSESAKALLEMSVPTVSPSSET